MVAQAQAPWPSPSALPDTENASCTCTAHLHDHQLLCCRRCCQFIHELLHRVDVDHICGARLPPPRLLSKSVAEAGGRRHRIVGAAAHQWRRASSNLKRVARPKGPHPGDGPTAPAGERTAALTSRRLSHSYQNHLYWPWGRGAASRARVVRRIDGHLQSVGCAAA